LAILLICTKRKMQPNLIDFSTALLSLGLTCAAEQSGPNFDAGGVRRRRSGHANNTASIELLRVTRRHERYSSILDLNEVVRVQAFCI
jgi:hypothetical protein